jgi:thioesterase-3
MEKSTTEIKVRGYHLDLNGHVNNARYLEFAEEARWNHYEDKLDWEAFKRNGWGFAVVNANIDFKYPVVLGDVLSIESGIINAGQRSVVMHQTFRIKDTDQVAAEIDITFVAIDVRTGKSIPLEGKLREMVLA